MTVIPDAELPYPEPDGTATAGWAGSDASHERAVRERDDGTASQRQQYVLRRLGVRGERGTTVKELREQTGMHHGSASGVLSVLHKTGRIACLDEKRDRCHVYVLPENVGDRTTREPGNIKGKPMVERQYDAFLEGFRHGVRISEEDVPPEDTIRVLFDYWEASQ